MKEEEEEEGTHGFEDWESLHSTHYRNSSSPPPPSSPSSSSSSSHFISPTQITTRNHDLSIFPPVNHEGLPISQSTSLFNSHPSSPPSSPPPPPRNSQLVTWFDFALHLWNSKLLSVLTHLRSPGFWSSLRPVTVAASALAFFWFWVWRRRKMTGEDGRVEQLKLLIKEKDEKILQLLEQITEMNKKLLTRYSIPVLKSS